MKESSLSPKAREILEAYRNLPIGQGSETPYFNNRRAKVMGGLRAFVGKGTPKDIAEEAEILSLKMRKNIKTLPREELKRFLVDHGLGIDCSGFAYHLLSKELEARKKKRLSSCLRIKGGLLNRLKGLLRPAESVGVSTFAIDANSVPVGFDDVSAGDFLAIMGTGKDKMYNHMIVITDVVTVGTGTILTYAHSYSWPSDGKYGHGVRTGEIRVTDFSAPITKALWTEKGVSEKDNYTLQSTLEAQSVSLRRLKIFNS